RLARERLEAAGDVEGRRTADDDAPGLLAELDDPTRGLLGRREVEVAQLRQRVADRLVDRSLSRLAAVDVRERDRERQRSDAGREHVEAVPEDDEQVRPRAVEGACELDDPAADRGGD